MHRVCVAFLTILALSICTPLQANDSGPDATQAIVSAVFTAAERETIHQYFLQHPDQLKVVDQVDAYAHGGGEQEESEQSGSGNWHGHGHGNSHGHGHGWKSRQGGLPPGIVKNLARGKPLPPGIAKQIQPLPSALQSELPPAPNGYERVIVDGKVLLVDVATQVIHDVIEDAVMGETRKKR